MELLERVRWTSETPAIYVNIYYEYQRSGADMKYRVKLIVEPVKGQSYFGYPIYAKLTSEGSERANVTLKNSSPSQWSSNIEWTSDWWTVTNKTTGTSSLAVNVYSGNGSSRNVTYNYSMYVAPAYTTVSTWSVASKTETSITLNWATAHTCSQIRYGTSTSSYSTANVNASSGQVTISGLSANTNYTLYFMPCRKDSSLWGDGNSNVWKSIANQKTYNWPNCTSAPNFTVGNSVTLTFENPLNRTFAIRMWSYTSQTFVTDSINVSGTSYTFTPNANTLYASIPNTKSSVYNIDCTYSGHKLTKTGGSYSINESTNKPTFSNFTYADTNATTTALTGNNQIVVQGYSNVTATVSTSNKATAQNSATMKKYNLIIGSASSSVDYSSSEDVSVTINNAQNGTITLYAEDSRSLSTAVTKTATLKAYTNIQKGSISITRQNNVGEVVTLSYNGTYWNESFGSQTNDIVSATYRFKKTTDNSWTTGTTSITPTKSDNTYSFEGGIVGDIAGTGFDASSSYNIEIIVTDKLSSTTFTTTLGSGAPNIAIVDGGVSLLGKYDESNTTEKIQLNANVKATGDINTLGNLKENNYAITPININGWSGTLLSKVKDLGTRGIYRATWFTTTDGGTSNISDKPTGTTNAGFVCTATCNRMASNSDYRYIVECYVQNDKYYYIAVVDNTTTSIGWTRGIGNGTLTIQKNGSNVATFGANSTSNVTANISVPTATSGLTNDSFKFRLYKKSMTIGAGGMASVDMGAINKPSGYSFLGCIAWNNGYSDQWVVTYSAYTNDHIIATGHSKYGASLTAEVQCYAVYIKDSIKSQCIIT